MEDYRHHWEQRFDRLDAYLRESNKPTSNKKTRARQKK
jgi:hypothetical protein